MEEKSLWPSLAEDPISGQDPLATQALLSWDSNNPLSPQINGLSRKRKTEQPALKLSGTPLLHLKKESDPEDLIFWRERQDGKET